MKSQFLKYRVAMYSTYNVSSAVFPPSSPSNVFTSTDLDRALIRAASFPPPSFLACAPVRYNTCDGTEQQKCTSTYVPPTTLFNESSPLCVLAPSLSLYLSLRRALRRALIVDRKHAHTTLLSLSCRNQLRGCTDVHTNPPPPLVSLSLSLSFVSASLGLPVIRPRVRTEGEGKRRRRMQRFTTLTSYASFNNIYN